MQEPVYVLHLITCHGRIMLRLAELLFTFGPYCELKSFFTLGICSCRQWVIAADKALFSSKNC